MQAIVITKPGPPSVLQIQEIAEPVPSSDEILVKVHATAVNRADLLQRVGRYPPPAGTRADVPGLEFAGEVETVGESISGFKRADRVMGLLPGEGYAEKIVTPARLAMPIPENLGYEQAAAIPEVFLTAYDALFAQLKLRMGERLLIHAVGSGVGTAALQLAKETGAVVFGTAGSHEKLTKAKELGLDFAVNYKTDNFEEVVLSETNREGVDAVFDMVGASHWEKNLACVTSSGRIIVVGLLGGARVEIDLARIMAKRIHIIGTVLRARPLEEKIALTQDFRKHVLPLFALGRIRPVLDRTFPFEKAAEAHAYMQANKNFGKIVLRVK